MRSLADRHDSVTTPAPERGDQRSVAVVGAGITGLVAAYTLQRHGVNVTLFEASDHVGGAIRTSHVDGFLAEHGPNSFVTSAPVESLLTELDLAEDVVEANPEANKRFVVRNGALMPFPLTPAAMLSTRLFSFKAKLRVLLEPLVPRGVADNDESVASFVRRRLGHEVLDYAVDPFVSGIFAGDAETLSMAHAFPRVSELERKYGSLSKGLMAERRAARSATPAPASNSDSTAEVDGSANTADDAPVRTRLISFLDGMQSLPDALADALGGTLKRECAVRLLHREGARWVVDTGDDAGSRPRTFDAVVMATPAHVLAAMELPGAMRKHATPVERVEYPAVSTLTLGFHRRDVAHALDGFGMLIPSREGRALLGALFSSSLFPNRAPDHYVTITSFLGGARNPQIARESTEQLIERTLGELRDLLGVRGRPVFQQHIFWPRAIPQYSLGYSAVKDAAEATEVANPGLYLAGNYRNGVSVGDCVASGQQIARRVEQYLTHAS